MSTNRIRATSDAGQALPLMVVVLLVAAAVLLAGVQVGPLLDQSAQARTAADAAALAGAAEGRDAAERFATTNGATLVAYSRVGSVTEVEVRVGGATAIARAAASVVWVPD